MKGGIVEILEPLVSITFAVILAMMAAYAAYRLTDIMGEQMAERHPTFMSLQMAGLTSAVAAAPERAVYCHELESSVDISMKFLKRNPSSMGVVITGVKEEGVVKEMINETAFTKFHMGPMPEPYEVNERFDIKKDRKFLIAIQKKNEQISVSRINDLEECGSLV